MRLIMLILYVAANALILSAQANSPWHMQDSGTNANLRGIYSVDRQVAWASGAGGAVLRTLDGGERWLQCSIPDAATDGATLDFRGVQAWDAQTAIVMASGPGDKSRLYKTADGCKTWTLLFRNPSSPEGFFDSVYFPRIQTIHRQHEAFGILLGDPAGGRLAVFETRDGGNSWTRISSRILDDLGTDPAAFAASNSCISGYGGSAFDLVVGGKAGDLLLRLNYKGIWWTNHASTISRTWERVSLPMAKNAESAGPFSLAQRARVAHGQKGLKHWEIAVGGDYTRPNERTGTAAWSSDGGSHWFASARPPHGYRSTVQWGELFQVWVTAGPNGSDISRDNGRTWQPLDNGNWNALSLPFIVGPHGHIARVNPDALKSKRTPDPSSPPATKRP